MRMEDKHIASATEKKMWGVLCNAIMKVTGLENKAFNDSEEIRELIEVIEEWAYTEHMRRKAYDDDEPRGAFWN